MPGQGWLKGHHRYVAALLLVGAAFTACGVALAYIKYCKKDIR